MDPHVRIVHEHDMAAMPELGGRAVLGLEPDIAGQVATLDLLPQNTDRAGIGQTAGPSDCRAADRGDDTFLDFGRMHDLAAAIPIVSRPMRPAQNDGIPDGPTGRHFGKGQGGGADGQRILDVVPG